MYLRNWNDMTYVFYIFLVFVIFNILSCTTSNQLANKQSHKFTDKSVSKLFFAVSTNVRFTVDDA